MDETTGTNGSPAADSDWQFAGWGTSTRIDDIGNEPIDVANLNPTAAHKLGEWRATAICGNDITSSCLYVSAFTIIAAGAYAPIALVTVAAVLYLFRNVYAEVGSALPLNGGTYTVLLNTTNKALAAGAACLTILSYIATAVISANEAMHYAHNLWHGLPVITATVVLLGLFAALNLVGISESAVVALVIFIFHITTLILLTFIVGLAVLRDPEVLTSSWHAPNALGFGKAIFIGFGAAMLGISGFESSANFIEEQEPGVFPKTLRNMWVAVSVFNPLMCVLALGVIPLDEMAAHTQDLLAYMGFVSAGEGGFGSFVRSWVSLDAVLVLSGAVLTSYVGVTGLIRRMSLDRCLPEFLLRKNRIRGTNHWIILGFFALCCSILFATVGTGTEEEQRVGLLTLGGVYTLSFLAVMGLFALGNMLLKVQRGRLRRAVRASWPAVVVAFAAVMVGLAANLEMDRIRIFGTYFAAVAAVVAVMFLRIRILSAILFMSRSTVLKVLNWIDLLTRRDIIYFTKGDDLATLNRAALYVLSNEQTRRLKVVHAFERREDIPESLGGFLATVDRLYPQLRIDFVAVQGKFGPELIERLSRRLGVPKNYMFIGTPGDAFPHEVEKLGGVRLIL